MVANLSASTNSTVYNLDFNSAGFLVSSSPGITLTVNNGDHAT